jgi:hypothetical protein
MMRMHIRRYTRLCAGDAGALAVVGTVSFGVLDKV